MLKATCVTAPKEKHTANMHCKSDTPLEAQESLSISTNARRNTEYLHIRFMLNGPRAKDMAYAHNL